MPKKSSRRETLPEPTGPYTVGYLDYEWMPKGTKAVPEPSSKFMMARLFYPSSLSHEEAQKQRGLWIVSRQEGEDSRYPMGIPKVVARLFIKLRLRKVHIWAVKNAPPIDIKDKESLPVIVFSHGMAGQRNMYSVICCELASQGFLVASIAHGDGTAWCRRVNGNTQKEPFVMPPKNSNGNDEDFWLLSRKPTRPQEMSLTVDMLKSMNSVDVADNLWKTCEPDSQYPDQIPNLKGRMDFSALVAMGHSFGGATALMASSLDQRIKRLVALDPWMYILDGTSPPAHIPTLVIHTKRFQRPEDIQQLQVIVDSAPAGSLLQLPDDAGHLDQTDMSCLGVGGRPAKFFTPRRFRHLLDFSHSSDPVGTIKLNNQHIIEFLTSK